MHDDMCLEAISLHEPPVTQSCRLDVFQIHETMWTGADQEFKAFPWKKMAKAADARKRSADEEVSRVKGLVKAEKRKRSKLESLGIDYDFEGFEALVEQGKPKRTKFDE